MPFVLPYWGVGAGAFLLLAGWLLYVYRLHPARRRERRVVHACRKAFGDEDYELIRFRLKPGEPSFTDMFLGLPSLPEVPRYFTYKVNCVEQEPDYSGMSRGEIGLVRRYLRRSADVPHYGREVLHPEGNPSSPLSFSTRSFSASET